MVLFASICGNNNLKVTVMNEINIYIFFLIAISGDYECRLKEKHIFRQISNGILSAKRTPDIQVTPVRQKVMCEPGKTVSLECSVKSPYKVKFKDLPVGKDFEQ